MKRLRMGPRRAVALVLLLALAGPLVLFRQPPLPPGLDVHGPPRDAANLRLLVDKTSFDETAGRPVIDQEIFNTLLEMIDGAETFLVADFFLWNPWTGKAGEPHRKLASELADALLKKRIENPEMPMLILTDPINRVYGRHAPAYFEELSATGVPVVFTRLENLQESNAFFAAHARFWRHILPAAWFPDFPNPFIPGGKSINAGETVRLLHFKANHRKVLIVGRRDAAPQLLISTMNPADGSSVHSNMALYVEGEVALDALRSELGIASWSAQPGHVQGRRVATVHKALDSMASMKHGTPATAIDGIKIDNSAVVEWLTEEAIARSLIGMLDAAGEGTRIRAAIFYFSDRGVVGAMKRAVKRGASLEMVMDANRDAFGRKKNGVPNRALAAEFMKIGSIKHHVQIRWAATHGEQFHAKTLRVHDPARGLDLLCLGSANWTRRNLRNLNLEANVLVRNAGQTGADFDRAFEVLWNNESDLLRTLPYVAFEEKGFSLFKKGVLYRFQEWSGLSTF